MNSLSALCLFFLPELSAVAAGLILFAGLLRDVRPGKGPDFWSRAACQLPWIGALAALFLTHHSGSLHSFAANPLTQAGKFFLAFLWMNTARHMPVHFGDHRTESQKIWNFFSICALLGLFVLLSARKATLFFVALELSAYSFYALTALTRSRSQSEATVKYFTFGALMSLAGVLGMAFLYARTGSLDLKFDGSTLGSGPSMDAAGLAAISLFWIPVLTKWTLAPFHFWAPDVYQAAPLPTTTLLASLSKAAALMFTALMWTDFVRQPAIAGPWLAIALISMTLGNLAALGQSDFRRLLAYSSVAQAGYIALALAAPASEARSSVFFYAVIYACANLGAFYVLYRAEEDQISSRQNAPNFTRAIEGYARKNPLLGLVLLLSLLSLAGVPPLAGFAGKWFLFGNAVKSGFMWPTLWAVLQSVLSLYYYLIIVKKAFAAPASGAEHHPSEESRPKESAASNQRLAADRWMALWIIVILIALGLHPGLLFNPLRVFLA